MRNRLSCTLFDALTDTAATRLVSPTLAALQPAPRAEQVELVCAENRHVALALAGDSRLIWMPPVHTADGSRSPAAL